MFGRSELYSTADFLYIVTPTFEHENVGSFVYKVVQNEYVYTDGYMSEYNPSPWTNARKTATLQR